MWKEVDSNLNLSVKQIKKLVYDNYGLICSIKKLDGEKDLNYRLISKSKKKYYLKIYPNKTDLSFVRFQTKLLDYLSKNLKTPINI